MEKQAKAQDQVAMPSQVKQHSEPSKRESETNDIGDRSQEARFGFTNIGGTGSVSIESHFSLSVFFYIYLYFQDVYYASFSFPVSKEFIKITLKNCYSQYYFAYFL